MELSSRLPAITEKQKAWAVNRCMDHSAYKTKKEFVCFDCGNRWPNDSVDLLKVACPGCGTKLDVETSRKRTLKGTSYFGIITTFEGFQVVRLVWIKQECRVGIKSDIFIQEVGQNWITLEGKLTTIGLAVMGQSMYYDQWRFDTDMEIRSWHERFNINPYAICPGAKYIDNIKRNGFKGNFHNFTPTDFFLALLKSPYVETLLKAGQYGMLTRSQSYDFDKLWPSVKICIRNNYVIKDASMWRDHINILKDLGKDLHNAKYVCPPDLKAAHRILIEKRRIIWEKKDFDKQVKKIAKEEELFKKEKGKFLGIQFTDGLIDIVVLDSVREYLIEGNELHHCVFTGEYYSKPESLILSARKAGKRLETIEVSLKSMDVVQCRGLLNESTEHHDQIISLVKNNINLIRKAV